MHLLQTNLKRNSTTSIKTFYPTPREMILIIGNFNANGEVVGIVGRCGLGKLNVWGDTLVKFCPHHIPTCQSTQLIRNNIVRSQIE